MYPQRPRLKQHTHVSTTKQTKKLDKQVLQQPSNDSKEQHQHAMSPPDFKNGVFDDPKHRVSGPGLIRTMYSAVSFFYFSLMYVYYNIR